MPDEARAVAPRLIRSTSKVASMTMLSRILGFVRDMLFAYTFGAAAGIDAFYVAFKIPNFMRRLFAEGAFSQAFVPILAEYQQKSSKDEVRLFIAQVSGTLGAVLLVITISAVLAAPLLISVFAPGFLMDPMRFKVASDLLRITFPYLFFISLTAMAGAVLNTYSSFTIPAFTPVLLNVCLITAAMFGAPHFTPSVEALAWGVFFAGIIQCLFQLPFLARRGLLVRPRFNQNSPGVKRVLLLMVPALFGVSVAQINLLLDTLFASFLQAGSISWLYYSDRLMNFPLGVFGVAIATVILPSLSKRHANEDTKAYSDTLDWALKLIFVIAIPAAIGLGVLSGPLLTTLFNYGQFDQFDVLMAQKSLIAFACGIPAFMLIKVLASGFYARQDIKTPVRIAVVAMLTNTTLNFILIHSLAHAGLALATSIAAILNASLLWVLLFRRQIYRPTVGWLRFVIQITIANTAMLIWLAFATPNLNTWFAMKGLARASELGFVVSISVIIYAFCLWLSGFRLHLMREA